MSLSDGSVRKSLSASASLARQLLFVAFLFAPLTDLRKVSSTDILVNSPIALRFKYTRPRQTLFAASILWQSDSEYMAGQLASYGYNLVEEPEAADLWLINT